jgi:dCMP deaminase
MRDGLFSERDSSTPEVVWARRSFQLVTRITWDEVWMRTAMTIAERSLCSRAQVGAVIVSQDNRVQSAAYNGPPPGFAHMDKRCVEWCRRAQPGAEISSDYSSCEAQHAEISALVRSDRSQLGGAAIYVSGAVCINCARSICHTGIIKVVHVVNESDAHRDPQAVESFLRLYQRQVLRYAL